MNDTGERPGWGRVGRCPQVGPRHVDRGSMMARRCAWAGGSDLDATYHDTEWGVPSHDDRYLFEMLILEGAQAGLSWTTILKKREAYRVAYRGFDPQKVARFDGRSRGRLLADSGIVRNRLKIGASIGNARAFLEVQREFGCFADFLWDFVGHAPVVNRRRSARSIPAENAVSRKLSSALKARGFGFVGPTICYAYMQAVGMVNDHEAACFRHSEVAARGPLSPLPGSRARARTRRFDRSRAP